MIDMPTSVCLALTCTKFYAIFEDLHGPLDFNTDWYYFPGTGGFSEIELLDIILKAWLNSKGGIHPRYTPMPISESFKRAGLEFIDLNELRALL